ncbi:YqgE/AlgH family protein [Aquirufa sp. ROCK2-A2]
MPKNYYAEDLKPGMLLLSEPYLEDASFRRSVILLCEHSNSHSFGIIINHEQDNVFETVMDEKVFDNIPLFAGGPVDTSILQFLHRRPDLIPGGLEIAPNIFWSGDFEKAIESVVNETITFSDIKFFIGYSGWGAGQLEREIKSNAWYLEPAKSEYVFDEPCDQLWRKILMDKGGNYRVLATYPEDPNLN